MTVLTLLTTPVVMFALIVVLERVEVWADEGRDEDQAGLPPRESPVVTRTLVVPDTPIASPVVAGGAALAVSTDARTPASPSPAS